MSVAPWDCFKGFEYALKVLKILHAYITTYTLPDFPLPDFPLPDLPDLPLQDFPLQDFPLQDFPLPDFLTRLSYQTFLLDFLNGLSYWTGLDWTG